MPRAAPTQFNIRSAFARSRAHELAQVTGMSVAQIVEDAWRGYVPPGAPLQPGGHVRRGAILVLPANGARITLAEAEAARAEVRTRDAED